MKPALDKEAVARRIHELRQPVTDALVRCVEKAQGHSGQAHIVAQGLLSAYDGRRFPFDITQLAQLDEESFRDLYQVWHQRQLGHEPHRFFHDGAELFERMAIRREIEGPINKPIYGEPGQARQAL